VADGLWRQQSSSALRAITHSFHTVVCRATHLPPTSFLNGRSRRSRVDKLHLGLQQAFHEPGVNRVPAFLLGGEEPREVNSKVKRILCVKGGTS
jgi:hypothetical protein